MIKVLISSPSMDTTKNVSGVASVVAHIEMALSKEVNFNHLEIGSEKSSSTIARTIGSLHKAASSLIKILTVDFAILHSNTALNPKSIVRDLVLIAATRLRGKGVLLHVHGGTYIHRKAPLVLQWTITILLSLANRIVVLSQTELCFINAEYPGSAKKTVFIYNGIDLGFRSHFQKKPPSDRLRVAFLGRLVAEKGIVYLIAACRRLTAENKVDIVFFGDGELLPEVRALTAEIHFAEYSGVFGQGMGTDILSKFDALILPSIKGEGMPMAVIEAMSVGVVPICCRLSSIPEIISDRETGLLIEMESPDAIVTAFLELKADPEIMRKMSCAAFRFAGTHFDARQNFEKLIPIYNNIVRG